MVILKFLSDAGVVGWAIMLVGAFCIGLCIERSRVLYKKFSLDTDAFFKEIKSYLQEHRYEDAIAYCAKNEKIPLASAFKTILEKSDQNHEVIFQAQDIALNENSPKITERIHYLSMLANVATLLGLLGTIHGLILSFQAVAQADPSMKQALLAHGISVSMYTTALGLAVAIPTMVAYSVLVSKQTRLSDELIEYSARLTQILTSVDISDLSYEKVYAHTQAAKDSSDSVSRPPKANMKVS